jgi:hypothetical protein
LQRGRSKISFALVVTERDRDQAGFIRSVYARAISAGRQANAGQPESKASKLVDRFARDAADILRFTPAQTGSGSCADARVPQMSDRLIRQPHLV